VNAEPFERIAAGNHIDIRTVETRKQQGVCCRIEGVAPAEDARHLEYLNPFEDPIV
jgi:hypothetical protein